MGVMEIKYGFRFSCDMDRCSNTKAVQVFQETPESGDFAQAMRLLGAKKWTLLRLDDVESIKHLCPKCGRRIAKKHQRKDKK